MAEVKCEKTADVDYTNSAAVAVDSLSKLKNKSKTNESMNNGPRKMKTPAEIEKSKAKDVKNAEIGR